MKAAGAAALVVHARKAWLEGLSPKDNRTVPPLDYPLVYALKRAIPAGRSSSTAASPTSMRRGRILTTSTA